MTIQRFLLFATLLVVASFGCGESRQSSTLAQTDKYATAIRKVLDEDKSAAERCTEAAKLDQLAAMREYAQTIRRIDLLSCPADFQEAFLKHKYAWQEVVPFLEKNDGFASALIDLFEVGAAIYRDQSLTTEGDREFNGIRKSINATFYEIERTALRYGVQIEH